VKYTLALHIPYAALDISAPGAAYANRLLPTAKTLSITEILGIPVSNTSNLVIQCQ
jgi:hypothetical protein